MREQTECDFKKAVVNQVKLNAVHEEIKNHLQACSKCRETEKIAQLFQMNFSVESRVPNLPTAGFVWWKAQILNKRRAAARTVQPLLVAQISAAIVGVFFCFWLVWTVPSLSRAADQIAVSIEQILPYLIGGLFSFVSLSLASIFLLRRFLLDK